jgi:hypothetical protein
MTCCRNHTKSTSFYIVYSSPTRPDSPTTTHTIRSIRSTGITSGDRERSTESGRYGIEPILNGMKSLVGMTYSASVSRVGVGAAAYFEQGGGGRAVGRGGRRGLSNFFLMKSAPVASGGSHAQRASLTPFMHGGGSGDRQLWRYVDHTVSKQTIYF